jgi:AcrR family transcriptional regulator
MKREMRDNIKKAARQIFIKQGIDKISMRNIASKINYSPTTIYLYYKNKDELLRDILADYNIELDQKMAGIICSNDDVLSKLRDFLLLYINQGINNPETYKLLNGYRFNMRDISQDSPENSKYFILKGFVINLIDAGIFEDSNPDSISLSLWLHCYGITTMAVFRPEMIKAETSEFVSFSLNKIIKSFRR